ncbi:MAG TPA: glycosyltransferase [Desulfobacterales bacterium]
MKLVVISPFLPYPPDSGGAIRIFNLIKQLSVHNDVTLLCYFNESQRPLFQDLGSYCRLILVPEKRYRRHWIYHLWYLMSPLPYSLVMIDKDFRYRIQEVIANGADIVQFEFLSLAHYHSCLPSTVRKVAAVHYLATESRRRLMQFWPAGIRKFYYRMEIRKIHQYERDVLGHFDLCLVTSESHRYLLRQWEVSTPIQVTPNGVDTDYFRSEPIRNIQGGRLAYMGAFHLEPANIDGFQYLVDEIFPYIRMRAPGVQLDVIGNGLPEQYLQKHRNDSVHIFGYVDDVRPILSSCDVFVLPLRGGSGTKIRILTAMAMAIPVVATSVGAEGLEVTPGENIFIADDMQQFAEKVLALLENGDLRNRMGNAGRRLVERRYGWQRIAADLNETYQGLLL